MITRLVLAAAFICSLGLSTATAQESSPTPIARTTYPLTVDNCGTSVTFDAAPTRVVTMDAYSAEFLITLGLGDLVVGTGFPYPSNQIPTDLADDFAAIPVIADFVPGREQIAALTPNLVLSAYSALIGDVEGQVSRGDMTELGANTFASCWDARTDIVTDIEDTYTFFTDLGVIFDVQDRAAKVVAEMRARQAELMATNDTSASARVFAIGSDPNDGQPIPTWGGGGIPNGIMTLAGCTNIFGDVADDSFFPSSEEVAARDPQVFMVVTDFATPDSTLLTAAIEASPLLSATSAGGSKSYVVVSHVLIGGPSPRNLDAVAALATACHAI